MKSCTLNPTQDVNHPFVYVCMPVSYLVAALVIRERETPRSHNFDYSILL